MLFKPVPPQTEETPLSYGYIYVWPDC